MMNHWEIMMACKLQLNSHFCELIEKNSHFCGLLSVIFFVISLDNSIDSLNLRL